MMGLNGRTILGAALLGTSSALRTFTPEAVLAARGLLTGSPRSRYGIQLAAAGELVADKLPDVPSRTEPLPFLGRVLSGGFCGHAAAGVVGVAPAVAASAAATVIGHRARAAATGRLGMPDLLAALLEDAVAIGAARLGATLTNA